MSETPTIRRYLAWPSMTGNPHACLVVVDGWVWLGPGAYPAVRGFHIQTQTMVEISPLPSGFSPATGYLGPNQARVASCAYDGRGRIWMPPYVASHMIVFDIASRSMSLFPNALPVSGFCGAVVVGDRLFLAGVDSQPGCAVSVNVNTNVVASRCNAAWGNFIGVIPDDRGNIWFAPWLVNNFFLRLSQTLSNPATVPFSTTASPFSGRYYSGVFAIDHIYFCPVAVFRILRVHVDTLVVQTVASQAQEFFCALALFDGSTVFMDCPQGLFVIDPLTNVFRIATTLDWLGLWTGQDMWTMRQAGVSNWKLHRAVWRAPTASRSLSLSGPSSSLTKSKGTWSPSGASPSQSWTLSVSPTAQSWELTASASAFESCSPSMSLPSPSLSTSRLASETHTMVISPTFSSSISPSRSMTLPSPSQGSLSVTAPSKTYASPSTSKPSSTLATATPSSSQSIEATLSPDVEATFPPLTLLSVRSSRPEADTVMVFEPVVVSPNETRRVEGGAVPVSYNLSAYWACSVPEVTLVFGFLGSPLPAFQRPRELAPDPLFPVIELNATGVPMTLMSNFTAVRPASLIQFGAGSFRRGPGWLSRSTARLDVWARFNVTLRCTAAPRPSWARGRQREVYGRGAAELIVLPHILEYPPATGAARIVLTLQRLPLAIPVPVVESAVVGSLAVRVLGTAVVPTLLALTQVGNMGAIRLVVCEFGDANVGAELNLFDVTLGAVDEGGLVRGAAVTWLVAAVIGPLIPVLVAAALSKGKDVSFGASWRVIRGPTRQLTMFTVLLMPAASSLGTALLAPEGSWQRAPSWQGVDVCTAVLLLLVSAAPIVATMVFFLRGWRARRWCDRVECVEIVAESTDAASSRDRHEALVRAVIDGAAPNQLDILLSRLGSFEEQEWRLTSETENSAVLDLYGVSVLEGLRPATLHGCFAGLIALLVLRLVLLVALIAARGASLSPMVARVVPASVALSSAAAGLSLCVTLNLDGESATGPLAASAGALETASSYLSMIATLPAMYAVLRALPRKLRKLWTRYVIRRLHSGKRRVMSTTTFDAAPLLDETDGATLLVPVDDDSIISEDREQNEKESTEEAVETYKDRPRGWGVAPQVRVDDEEGLHNEGSGDARIGERDPCRPPPLHSMLDLDAILGLERSPAVVDDATAPVSQNRNLII